MKILVTGGAGYIGSLLVPALLAEGHHVTVVDRFLYGDTSLNAHVYWPELTVIRADVRHVMCYRDALTACDIFIPLACLVGAPVCNQNVVDATAVNYSSIIAALMNISSEQRIIFPTTNSGYGRSDTPCTEDTPLKPLSLYARTKVDAERAVLDRGNAITFRLATAFGVSPRHRVDLLVNDFVYRAVRDRSLVLYEPHFRRNFIHVRDIVRVFLHAIVNFSTMKNRPYNVGDSNANLTKLELCQRIARHVHDFDWHNAKPGTADPDQRDYLVDNSRIEATGWKPKHTLDDGISELVKLYSFLRNERYGNI